jgi:streptogramin lyase
MKAIIFPVKHRYKYWLSVAIAAAVTLGLNVALSRAALPTYPACINQATLTPVPNGVHFEYQICQVPDIDQVRTGSISPLIFGLPNEGKMYCLPTSAMNWIAYIANHGYPQVQPFPGDWELGPPTNTDVYNLMSLQLSSLGGVMKTDPFNGTSGDNAQKGLQEWLDTDAPGHFVVSNYYAKGSYSPQLHHMGIAASMGALIMPVVGWYTNADGSGTHIRKGGHMVSLVGASGDNGGSGTSKMTIHDPARPKANSSSTQSPFSPEEYDVDEVAGDFGYEDSDGVAHTKYRTQGRVAGYGSGYLDGYLMISPKFGLTASENTIIKLNFHHLLGVAQQSETVFQSATGGKVIDLAVHPEGAAHPYLIEGSDAVWMLDTIANVSRQIAAVEKPKRIVFGGREQSLYVLGAKEIVKLDRNGVPQRRRPLRTPVDAVAFDESRGRLVGVTQGARGLVFFDEDLTAVGGATLPGDAGEGRISLGVNPKDGTMWLHRDGSSSLLRLRSDRDRLEKAEVRLEGAGAMGLYVDERGSLFVNEGGRLASFNQDGRRIERAHFTGRAVGGILRMLQPFSNFDPSTMAGPAFHNVLPEEATR